VVGDLVTQHDNRTHTRAISVDTYSTR
jgi:hypothetical protein